MLLANGSVVYYGPANQAVNYFTSIGYPCPEFTNPSDYFSKNFLRIFLYFSIFF